MQRRLRRTTRQYIAAILIGFLLAGSGFVTAYFFVIKRQEKVSAQKISRLTEQLDNKKRWVCVASTEIPAGVKINENMIEHKLVISEETQEHFARVTDVGKVSLLTIPKGTYLHKNMLMQDKITNHIREVMFECIHIHSNISKEAVIDVRISFPNGEDYIVLSKQTIRDLSEGNERCFFWINEEEIQLMSSAIVDAYRYEGAYLYATKYIRPTIQDASYTTYQPSMETIALMKKNENIVQIAQLKLNENLRREMDQRMIEYKNDYIVRGDYNNRSDDPVIDQEEEFVPDIKQDVE